MPYCDWRWANELLRDYHDTPKTALIQVSLKHKNCSAKKSKNLKPLRRKAFADASFSSTLDIETLEPQWLEGFALFVRFVGKPLFPTILPTNPHY